ncbi:hypothetical protein ACH4GK_38565 [Streptomyces rimosus]|uniref:hypothetical protein n=1 Tax=Streptomyces rimosus TaxID=1927 RepID=UPI0004C6AF2F|nr:hypothetical protein [Streptomyces rimosus]
MAAEFGREGGGRALTTDRLRDGHRDDSALVLGTVPTLLPPAVHRLLRRQAEHARQESAISRTTPPTAWLFPGYAAGTHRPARGLT